MMHKVLSAVAGVVVILVAVALVLVFGVFRPFDVKPVANTGKVKSASKCTSMTIVSYAADSTTICLEDVKNPLEKQVLADAHVSQEEYQEVLDAYVACLAAEGITATNITPNGGGEYGYVSKAAAQAAADKGVVSNCRASTGFNTVGQKYNQEVTNPDNLDGEAWTDAWMACFVRMGWEPEGFTEADYAALSQADRDKLSSQPRYMDCMNDPLHTQP
jgi:hypothetical protein